MIPHNMPFEIGAEIGTKVETDEGENNSSLIVLNHHITPKNSKFLVGYFPDEIFTSYKGGQFYHGTEDFMLFRLSVWKGKNAGQDFTVYPPVNLPIDFYISQIDGFYYTSLMIKEGDRRRTTVVAGRRDYVMPFLIFPEERLQSMLFDFEYDDKTSERLISGLEEIAEKPFEQIKAKRDLPESLMKYDLKGVNCRMFRP